MINTIIKDIDALELYKTDYLRIFHDNVRYMTPYQSFDWNYCYSKYFLGNNKLNILLNKNMIIPVWNKDYNSIKTLEFIGTRGTDYLNFVGKFPDETAKAFIDYFVKNDATDLIYLEDIIETNEIIGHLKNEAYKHNLLFHTETNCPIGYIQLPATTDKYLDTLSKRTRRDFYYDIRYVQRKLNSQLQYKVDNSKTALLEHISLHQKLRTYKNTPGAYYKPTIINFMQDFIMSWSPKQRRISTLRIHNEPVASILSVVLDNRVYLITVGFDPDYKNYDVGKILFIQDILNCITCGFHHYDLSRGGEDYKQKLGCTSLNNLRVYIAKRDIISDFKKAYDIVKKGIGYNPDL